MNVVALAFFRGKESEYEQGANPGGFFRGYLRSIVRAHHSVWPDWAMWFYHDNAVRDFAEFKLLERYQEAGLVKLIERGSAEPLTASMLWRLLPAWEPGVDRFLCRDIDSLPQPRERKAVERWIASGKPINALHDSTSHQGTAIMGGMCGFVASYVREKFNTHEIFKLAMQASGVDFARKGGDQHFLNQAFPYANEMLSEWVDPESGPWDLDRNFAEGWARCVGGGFIATHVPAWFDKRYPNPRIIACES